MSTFFKSDHLRKLYSDLNEIGRKMPARTWNITSNFEAVWGRYGLKRLIIVYFHSGIILQWYWIKVSAFVARFQIYTIDFSIWLPQLTPACSEHILSWLIIFWNFCYLNYVKALILYFFSCDSPWKGKKYQFFQVNSILMIKMRNERKPKLRLISQKW